MLPIQMYEQRCSVVDVSLKSSFRQETHLVRPGFLEMDDVRQVAVVGDLYLVLPIGFLVRGQNAPFGATSYASLDFGDSQTAEQELPRVTRAKDKGQRTALEHGPEIVHEPAVDAEPGDKEEEGGERW